MKFVQIMTSKYYLLLMDNIIFLSFFLVIILIGADQIQSSLLAFRLYGQLFIQKYLAKGTIWLKTIVIPRGQYNLHPRGLLICLLTTLSKCFQARRVSTNFPIQNFHLSLRLVWNSAVNFQFRQTTFQKVTAF